MAQSNESLETSPNNEAAASVADNSKPAPGGGVEEKPRKLSLAELFAEDQSEDESSNDFSDDDLSKPIDSIDRLLKRTKLTPEQAYAIKVPMPNGAEPMTLGQLKDLAVSNVDLEARELEFEQTRVKKEGELLRTQSELHDLLQLIPKENLTPALIKKVRDQHSARMAREKTLMLEHIPSWADDDKRTEDIQGINEFLSNYGFSEAFITTVNDHRMMKFLRDMYLRDKRIQKALADVKKPEKKSVRPSQKPAHTKQPSAQRMEKRIPANGKLLQMFKS